MAARQRGPRIGSPQTTGEWQAERLPYKAVCAPITFNCTRLSALIGRI